MRAHADAFFTTGLTHDICEDYSRAGFRGDGTPYVVVCDGCSSSAHTDVGARLLAAAVAGQATSEFEVLHVLLEAAGAAAQVRVPAECLDTTLLLGFWDEAHQADGSTSRCVRVVMWGDGAVAARKRNGEMALHTVEHPDGAPRTPATSSTRSGRRSIRGATSNISGWRHTPGASRTGSPGTCHLRHVRSRSNRSSGALMLDCSISLS
ncbi:protein phosphatase 2C domain-containing protein [Nannocystis pusilla]|uniref:protein phosphatase 2C domain-containing protein n=1 Tax=Nannocystis pusilla TaxID=889268 RepID=UPI003B7C3279